MTYKRKTVSFKKEDFEQLTIYIDQIIETACILKERNEKSFKLNDFLTALEIHIEILKDYQNNLFDKYNLDYVLTLEKLSKIYD